MTQDTSLRTLRNLQTQSRKLVSNDLCSPPAFSFLLWNNKTTNRKEADAALMSVLLKGQQGATALDCLVSVTEHRQLFFFLYTCVIEILQYEIWLCFSHDFVFLSHICIVSFHPDYSRNSLNDTSTENDTAKNTLAGRKCLGTTLKHTHCDFVCDEVVCMMSWFLTVKVFQLQCPQTRHRTVTRLTPLRT